MAEREIDMDKTDQKIIGLLSENARLTYKQIADAVSLSSPAVKTRINKLEKEGIIKGYALRLNEQALGYAVHAFISVSVDQNNKEPFLAFVKDCPHITECYGITGDYYALLKVHFRSTMELDHFLSDVQHFGETRTNIVLSHYKEL